MVRQRSTTRRGLYDTSRINRFQYRDLLRLAELYTSAKSTKDDEPEYEWPEWPVHQWPSDKKPGVPNYQQMLETLNNTRKVAADAQQAAEAARKEGTPDL